MNRKKLTSILAALALAGCLFPAATWANPPAPLNDNPANAEVITTLPALIFGTTVLADNSINDSGGALPAINSYMDGPDVFYSITPGTTATYRFMFLPWQRAPLRSSDRRFTMYAYEALSGTFVAGTRAAGSARPFEFDVLLTAGTEYIIGVDHDSATHDNFEFTLMVDELNLINPDDCASAAVLTPSLPVVVLNNIDGAANDFQFVDQGSGQCAVSGTPTTGPGPDHVYEFTAPADGLYAIEVASNGFDAVLYVEDSCPPFFFDGCLGASNHSTSGTSGAKHELVVVELEATKTYHIFIDDGSTTAITGSYSIIIDDAFNYEMNEVEPNDAAIDATPIDTPLNGGQLVGPLDEDWWAVTGLTGDRVYAWVNNGGSSNSTLDTDLGFYAVDGSTLIEFDDEDGDGADAPIEDLRYIYSTTAPVIAGARMTSDGTHYLRVIDQSATGTVHRYRFHTGVEPAARSPLAECEPNNTIASADYSGKLFYAGVIPTTDDSDFYAFDANVGDRVFIAVDGDPERDSTGNDSGNTDPNAFHAKAVIYDPAGDVLISDISDANSITFAPDYPAQGGYFVARTTGRHYVEIKPQSTSSQVGPTETYEVAIFINEERGGAATEDVDPVVALAPDYANDFIGVTATDNAIGDSGICDAVLVDSDNLVITGLAFTPGDGIVTFQIDVINPAANGTGKLMVMDCAGNTSCQYIVIDVFDPICDGYNFSKRVLRTLEAPIHVTDNDLTGINGIIDIGEAGLVADVNVLVNIDAIDPADLDIYLESPLGTRVELVTDRMSSLAFDCHDAKFDDSASEIMPILSSAAPYTGTWLPEGSLAAVNGEQAMGAWKLNVIDDASSDSFGATLVYWELEIEASFPGPESFAGTATDESGLQSVVLLGATNTQIDFPAGFTPGDLVTNYVVSLIDPTLNGSGTVQVTDLQGNTCDSVITLNALADAAGPANTGGVTTDLTYKQEVQTVVPAADPVGVTSTINVPESFLVGEVEIAMMVDADDQGRMAAKLTHNGEFASLINRIGQDERSAAGNTKPSWDITLDDDAPEASDIHLEPALGTIATLGLYQPDGRGEYYGDGITADKRDNMLFVFDGQDSAGAWELHVADTRLISSADNSFRRWAVTLKSPCGAERYVGRAIDRSPGTGICGLALSGDINLSIIAAFTPGDDFVDYRVELVDPAIAGSGTLEITDCAGNVTFVPISLAAASDDGNLPLASGAVNMTTFEFEGTASDNQVGDSGVAAIELLPWSTNLTIVSTSSLPSPTATFTVGLANPAENGRGYVRVTDACGLRAHVLVEIDAQPPVCSGEIGNTKRFYSTDLPQPLPDNNAAGVVSDIVVTDTDLVSDVNITFNITHPMAMDIDMSLVSPAAIELMTDIGSTGNDFIDTTLDDDAAAPIPSSSSAAPWTGSFQPEGGPALFVLDGNPANGTYSLKVADDKANDTGSWENWSLVLESATYPLRFDGRAEDNLTFDSGVCSVELLPGAFNVVLTIEPWFAPGAPIVRYSVDRADPAFFGSGTIRVTDCAGNTCEIEVELGLCGDFTDNGAFGEPDGLVNQFDYFYILDAFASCTGDPKYKPAADLNADGCITWLDYILWVQCYRDANPGETWTPPVPKKTKKLLPRPPAGDESIGAGQSAPTGFSL